MARVLIICPTFDHQDTLYPTLESVRRQSFQDFEVVVIGDGAPERTARIMSDIRARDPRFRYEWHPKHERMGEPHRDALIRASSCEMVAYIADADLWLPRHLEWLVGGLEQHDFAHSLHYMVHLDGHIQAIPFQFASPEMRALALARRTWCFGLSFAAHTRSAYLRLPEGWATTPQGTPTDLNMWAKFAAHPGLRCFELLFPSALHLHAGLRSGMTPHARAADGWRVLHDTQDPHFVHSLFDRASFAQHFAYLCDTTTPRRIAHIDAVLAYHALSVQTITPDESLPSTPQAGALYCRPAALQALDIHWRSHAGHLHPHQAITAYKSLLECMPWNHDVRTALAELYLTRQQPRRALALTMDAFDLDTTARKYMVVHVKALVAVGQFTEALEHLDTLIEREPHAPYLHHHRGRALAGRGDVEAALSALQVALSLRQTMPWTHMLIARLLRDKHPAQAAHHVREAVQLGAPTAAVEPLQRQVSSTRPDDEKPPI